MGTTRTRYPYVQVRYDPADKGKPRKERRVIAYRACPTVNKVREFGRDRATPKEAYDDAVKLKAGERLATVSHITLQAAINEMIDDLRSTISAGTIGFYRLQAKAIFRFVEPEATLIALTAAKLNELIEMALRADYSTQTVCHYKTLLSRLISWCKMPQRKWWVGDNPVPTASWPTPQPRRPDVLSEEEMQDHLEKLRRASAEDYDLVMFMALSGLRRAEMARLHADDVQFPIGIFYADGKNREEPAPITAQLRPFLNRLVKRAKGGYLVQLRKVPPPGKEEVRRTEAVARVFRRWCELCSDRRLHPHTMRHTLATVMLRNGVELGRVQKMLRHSVVQTTNRYVHLVPEDLHAAIGTISYVKRPKKRKKKAKKHG